MQKSMRFCHVAHSMKIIEMLLNHIKDKNKFKNRDTLFPLVQCFKTFFLSHTQKLYAFPFTISTSTHLYTFDFNPSCYLISNTLKQKMMSFIFNLSMTPT